MLLSLHVRDLALIERAELRFDAGLNVLSGETGGGKSLIVTALKLLRGEKMTGLGDLVRRGARELRVEGEFALGQGERSRAIAALVADQTGAELDTAGESLVVTRIVEAASGRSRARIAGRPATLAQLRELGAWLLEIHGQGESRALMRPEMQGEMLDVFAGDRAPEARQAFATALAEARSVRGQLERIDSGQQQRQERAAFLRFQLAEIDDVALAAGEHERTGEEHRLLSHLDAMRERLTQALAALADRTDDADTASDLLGRARRALEEAAEIDRRLEPALESVCNAADAAADAAREVQGRLAALDLDPARLGVVEERLAVIERLLDRFGPTENDVLRRRDEIATEIEELDGDAAQPEALAARLRERLDDLAKAGRELVRLRKKAAPKFRSAIEAELAGLGMAATRVRADIGEGPDDGTPLDVSATANGPGPVELMVRINPGEPFKALRKTASGGETARIVLAIKKSLADLDRVPFVVFDEIDSEIGGRLGLQVGRKLREVARRHHQVFIVTHLPQVAAFADAHFQVAKHVTGGRTRSVVEELDSAGRERELAAMAAGEGADATAIAEARKLVAKARSDDAST